MIEAPSVEPGEAAPEIGPYLVRYDVGDWHDSDVPRCRRHFRYRAQPGHSADSAEGPR
jgi:hypothetical protein